MLAPTNNREKDLLAQGRSAEKGAAKLRAQSNENKQLKKEVSAVKREARADLAEAEAEPTHKLAMGGGVLVGAAAGVGGQHYVVDKYVANKWARRGILPGLGVVGIVAGLFMRGAAGDLVFGLSAGITVGSGATSAVKAFS